MAGNEGWCHYKCPQSLSESVALTDASRNVESGNTNYYTSGYGRSLLRQNGDEELLRGVSGCTDDGLTTGNDQLYRTRNGQCDDGGPGSEYNYLLPGTDASDCGCSGERYSGKPWFRFEGAAGTHLVSRDPRGYPDHPSNPVQNVQMRCGYARMVHLCDTQPVVGAEPTTKHACLTATYDASYDGTRDGIDRWPIETCACSYDGGATTTYLYKLTAPPGIPGDRQTRTMFKFCGETRFLSDPPPPRPNPPPPPRPPPPPPPSPSPPPGCSSAAMACGKDSLDADAQFRMSWELDNGYNRQRAGAEKWVQAWNSGKRDPETLYSEKHHSSFTEVVMYCNLPSPPAPPASPPPPPLRPCQPTTVTLYLPAQDGLERDWSQIKVTLNEEERSFGYMPLPHTLLSCPRVCT